MNRPAGSKKLRDLGILLLLALVMRLVFYVGIGSSESLENTGSAWQLLADTKRLAGPPLSNLSLPGLWSAAEELMASYGLARLLFLFPVSALYWLWGANDFTSLILPVFAGLLNIVALYLLGRKIFDRQAAILAALLWALLPLDIFSSTQLLFIETRVALFTVVIYLLLDRFGDWLLPRLNLRYLVVSSLVFLLLVTVTSDWWAADFHSVYLILRTQPGALLFFPLTFLGIALGRNRSGPSRYLLHFWLIVALTALLAAYSPEAAQAGKLNVYLLFLFMPALLFAGDYLASFFELRALEKSLPVLCIVIVTAALLMLGGQDRLIPSLAGLDWISRPGIVYVFRALAGLVFLGIILGPLILSAQSVRRRNLAALGLAAAVCLAMLPQIWDTVDPLQAQLGAMRNAYAGLADKKDGRDLFVYQDRRIVSHFEFLSGYQGDFLVRDVVGPTELDELNGRLVYWDASLSLPLADWQHEGVFGDMGNPRLEIAHRSIHTDACKTYQEWLASDHHRLEWIPVELETLRNCAGLGDLQDRTAALKNQFTRGFTDPILVDYNTIVNSHKYLYFADPRVFDALFTLEPTSFYLYSIKVKTVEPVMLLYFSTADEEHYSTAGSFKEWTTISILIATPHWEREQTASLSPVLFHHFGDVHLREFYFEKLASQLSD